MRTVKDCLRDGFTALLRGDTKERDEQMRLAKHIMGQDIRIKEGGPSPVDLAKGPDGIYIPKTNKND